MQPARQQQVAGLAAEEGHGMAGVDRQPHHRAGGAVHAARQIDGNHRHPAAFMARIMARGRPSTSRSRPAPNRASMTMSQSLSETGEACSTGPLQRSAASAASPFSRACCANEADAHRIAALGQMARRDETVTAIVARPRHNHHAPALQQGARRIGHGAAGILHQVDAGHAAGDGQPVGLRHFGVGEEFDHRGRDYRAAARPTNRANRLPRADVSGRWQKFLQGA